MFTKIRTRNSLWFSNTAGSIISLLLLISHAACAQVFPSEGSMLNYRIVGFSFPPNPGSAKYTVEIATGKFDRETDFAGRITQKVTSDKNKIILEVPSFGTTYTWRVVYSGGNSEGSTRSTLHHFTTGSIPEDSIGIKRLRITANAKKYKDAYVLIDGINTMYDMDGKPVWYIPEFDPLMPSTDVKVSPSGTITFMVAGEAFDIDYNGKVLWKAKSHSGDEQPGTQQVYHHELTKMANGHYLVLIASISTAAPKTAEKRKRFFPPMFTSTITEIDKKGTVIWSWNGEDYLQHSDLTALLEQYPEAMIDLHENALYFDEKNNLLYVSMAGISRIVKIQYPSGKVLSTYGTAYSQSAATAPDSDRPIEERLQHILANKQFFYQHSLKKSKDDFIYVCSSALIPGNSSNGVDNHYPKILKLKESGDVLETAWELDCRPFVKDITLAPGGGGNVVILPDNSLFVSMCSPFDGLFIVDANKNVLWSAMTEVYQQHQKTWVQYSKYRASIVTRKQLEQMIFRSER